MREIDILKRVRDKNILRCLEVVDQGDYVFIITEYCDADLSKLIYDQKVSQKNPKKALELLAQVISGY